MVFLSCIDPFTRKDISPPCFCYVLFMDSSEKENVSVYVFFRDIEIMGSCPLGSDLPQGKKVPL